MIAINNLKSPLSVELKAHHGRSQRHSAAISGCGPVNCTRSQSTVSPVMFSPSEPIAHGTSDVCMEKEERSFLSLPQSSFVSSNPSHPSHIDPLVFVLVLPPCFLSFGPLVFIPRIAKEPAISCHRDDPPIRPVPTLIVALLIAFSSFLPLALFHLSNPVDLLPVRDKPCSLSSFFFCCNPPPPFGCTKETRRKYFRFSDFSEI